MYHLLQGPPGAPGVSLMGQKGEPGAPGPGMGRTVTFGDPSVTAPPLGFARPGKAIHDFQTLVLQYINYDAVHGRRC